MLSDGHHGAIGNIPAGCPFLESSCICKCSGNVKLGAADKVAGKSPSEVQSEFRTLFFQLCGNCLNDSINNKAYLD